MNDTKTGFVNDIVGDYFDKSCKSSAQHTCVMFYISKYFFCKGGCEYVNLDFLPLTINLPSG